MHNALEVIRTAGMEQLLDEQWLTDAILHLGLGSYISTHGARELSGHYGGMGIWQYPIQLAPYLIYLHDQGIRRYAEIGLAFGGTMAVTVAYLDRFTPIEAILAIDAAPTPELRELVDRDGRIALCHASSHSEEAVAAIREFRPDLTMIDADHSEWACRHDYEMVRSHSRIIAFHDITECSTPGVAIVWAQSEGCKVEFTKQYATVADYFGIGVLHAKS